MAQLRHNMIRKGRVNMRFLTMVSILILLVAGAFVYWQWDQVQHELTSLRQELQSLQERFSPTPEDRELEQTRPVTAEHQITVYFLEITDTDIVLRPEVRSVSAPLTIAKAVDAVIAGPETPGLQPVLPSGTRLLSVQIDNGTAVLDFSQELQSNFNMGSQGEALLLQSLMRTLAAFSTISHVQILLEGETIESIGGHVAIESPLRITDF